MTEPEAGPASEVIAIRNEMATVNAGSPRARELDALLQGFYRGRHPEPAPSPSPTTSTDAPREPASAPPAASEPRPNVVQEPHAEPRTAAELDAVPLPEGLDLVMSKAVNAAAERAGVTEMVLEGRRVIARARSAGAVDFSTLEQRLGARYGRALPSKLDAFFTALDDPDFPPAFRADLERNGIDLNDEVFDYLARMGEKLMDVTTPGGERRLREKYSQREAS